MAWTRDQLKSKTTELLGYMSPEHQAKVTEILTQFSDEYNNVLTENESSASKVKELTTNNEQLRKVNTDLFLRVGETVKEAHKEEITESEPPENQITFESLFNEKGELQ